MPGMVYLYLAIAIVAEVIATTSLKAADGFSRPWPSVAVVVGYGVAFYFLSLCLKTLDVGITYAIWSGVGIVLVTIAAAVFYKQRPDAWAPSCRPGTWQPLRSPPGRAESSTASRPSSAARRARSTTTASATIC